MAKNEQVIVTGKSVSEPPQFAVQRERQAWWAQNLGAGLRFVMVGNIDTEYGAQQCESLEALGYRVEVDPRKPMGGREKWPFDRDPRWVTGSRTTLLMSCPEDQWRKMIESQEARSIPTNDWLKAGASVSGGAKAVTEGS